VEVSLLMCQVAILRLHRPTEVRCYGMSDNREMNPMYGEFVIGRLQESRERLWGDTVELGKMRNVET
jgi:hypothetical protein